jgi:hypothetical protein
LSLLDQCFRNKFAFENLSRKLEFRDHIGKREAQSKRVMDRGRIAEIIRPKKKGAGSGALWQKPWPFGSAELQNDTKII